MNTGPSEWLPVYAKHVLIAWPGLFVAILLIGMAVSATPLEYFFSEFSAPWFPGVIGCGLLAGFYFNRRERARAATLAFLPALIAFAFFAREYIASPLPYGGWAYFWQNHFTSDCGASECLGELFATWPLYAGIAYSIGAWWARRRKEQSAIADRPPDGSA